MSEWSEVIKVLKLLEEQNHQSPSQDLKHSKICLQAENVNVTKNASYFFFLEELDL